MAQMWHKILSEDGRDAAAEHVSAAHELAVVQPCRSGTGASQSRHDADVCSGRAGLTRGGAQPGQNGYMARTIATNTAVDLQELLKFVRPRHHMVLLTRGSDGAPQVSPVTGGVDDNGRIVISTYQNGPRRSTRGVGRRFRFLCCPMTSEVRGCKWTVSVRSSTCRSPSSPWSSTSAASPANARTGASPDAPWPTRASRYSGSSQRDGDRSLPEVSQLSPAEWCTAPR